MKIISYFQKSVTQWFSIIYVLLEIIHISLIQDQNSYKTIEKLTELLKNYLNFL